LGVARGGNFFEKMYITATQLYGKIPQPKVNDALDDDGSGDPILLAAALNQTLQNASDQVDAMLQGRFPVPFPGPPPVVVVQAALFFACHEIWGRRPIAGVDNPYSGDVKFYRAKLTAISARELGLDAATQEVITPGAAILGEDPINASMR